MASKIHIFRKSAMEAGNPGKYYINPSQKLMSKASEWRVIEHEDGIELIFNLDAFGDSTIFGKRYNYQAIGDCENKDDYYSYIVNTDFLNDKEANREIKDGFSKIYYPKIKPRRINFVGVQAE
ncbi:hypothetical protein MKX03_016102 [Papaver bracteatum]|nr:hypothetical protein MKX03_016102 [Papaver bracteatum]